MENNTLEKKHGLGLKIFLALMIILNLYTTFLYLTGAETLASFIPKASPVLIYFLGFMALVNVGLAILVLYWKRNGVYGFFAVSILAFLINMYLGLGIVSSLIGTLGAVIMYLLTRKKWPHFN